MFRMIAGLERAGIYCLDGLTRASVPLRFHRRFSPLSRLPQPQALFYDREYVCMYVCMHVCMYVCMYVGVCLCVCFSFVTSASTTGPVL